MMETMRSDDFERLYEEHAGPLLSFLTYRTGNRAVAEDVLADTFERVLRARRRFDPRKASEKTWLYTIAVNLVRDHERRRGAESRALERSVPVASGEGPGPLEAVDDRDALAQAMQRLGDEEREAIALRYGADLTLPEIARLTREKLTTVEGRVYRALRKLREELG
jgi:RNA polymerase sigma factor (sigma-70 family)